MSVFVYVNTGKEIGDPGHIKVFANLDAKKRGSPRTISRALPSSGCSNECETVLVGQQNNGCRGYWHHSEPHESDYHLDAHVPSNQHRFTSASLQQFSDIFKKLRLRPAKSDHSVSNRIAAPTPTSRVAIPTICIQSYRAMVMSVDQLQAPGLIWSCSSG